MAPSEEGRHNGVRFANIDGTSQGGNGNDQYYSTTPLTTLVASVLEIFLLLRFGQQPPTAIRPRYLGRMGGLLV